MKRSLIFVLIFLSASTLHAQYSSESYRGSNVHTGNRVHTVSYNYGLSGRAKIGVHPTYEWPAGTGNEYLGDFNPMIGFELIHPCGDTLHPVTTCDSPRGATDINLDGTEAVYEPIPGYFSTAGEEITVAMSHQPFTWPDSWSGRSDAWAGEWIGMGEPGVTVAAQESYFLMDDHNDREWRTRPDGDGVSHTLYPFPDDTARGGFGLTVEVRGLQFADPLLQDALIWVYIIHNEGVLDLKRVRFGLLPGTLMGGDGDSEDDLVGWAPEINLAYAYDSDGVGNTAWVDLPEENITVGYYGCQFLKTPNDSGLTSLDHFAPPGALRLNNDQGLWDRLEPGRYDNIEGVPEDGDMLVGTGDFELTPGSTDTVVFASLFAGDLERLEALAKRLQVFYDNGWQFPTDVLSINNLEEGDTLVGTAQVAFTAPLASDSVQLRVSYDAPFGETWQNLSYSLADTGYIGWDTEGCPDGSNVHLRLEAYADGALIEVTTSERLLVNNAADAAPDLFLISPNLEGEWVGDALTVEWWAGDAEGMPVTLDLDYMASGVTTPVANGIENSGSYLWEGASNPNSSEGYLVLTAHAGSDSTVRTSSWLRKQSSGLIDSSTTLQHIMGVSNALLSLRNVGDYTRPDHEFHVDFDFDEEEEVFYRIIDTMIGDTLVKMGKPGITEGPEFAGMRLMVTDPVTAVNREASGWKEELGQFEAKFALSNFPSLNVAGTPHRADFRLVFADAVVDTSELVMIGTTEVDAVPVPFTVYNMTEGKQQEFAFIDGSDYPATMLHSIILLMDSLDGELVPTWQVSFSSSSLEGTVNEPTDGDTLLLYITKSLAEDDLYSFVPNLLQSVSETPNQLPARYSLGPVYPNPFNPTVTIPFELQSDGVVELAIYNVLGRRVSLLLSEPKRAGEYRVRWDSVDESGVVVSSGLYFVQLKAGDFRTVRKMVLLK